MVQQTVVVMHGKKLVEMVVDSLSINKKGAIEYSLKYSEKPKKPKEIKTKAKADWRNFHNVFMTDKPPLINCGCRPAGNGVIVVDDIDSQGKIKVLVTYHTYKEADIFTDFEGFLSTVKLVQVYVPAKKQKAIV